jgi:hypothetical protein
VNLIAAPQLSLRAFLSRYVYAVPSRARGSTPNQTAANQVHVEVCGGGFAVNASLSARKLACHSSYTAPSSSTRCPCCCAMASPRAPLPPCRALSAAMSLASPREAALDICVKLEPSLAQLQRRTQPHEHLAKLVSGLPTKSTLRSGLHKRVV